MTDEIEVILPAPIEVVVDSGGGGSSVWGTVSGDIQQQLDLVDLVNTRASVEALAATDWLLNNELSNGVKSGMILSVATDPTRINISAGSGLVVDNSDPSAPVLTPLSFAGVTDLVLPYISLVNATYIGITSAGLVIQQTTDFTDIQRRNLIILGAAIHSNRTTVNVVNNLPDVALSATSQINDLMTGLKNFNISGNIISAHGADLSINKSMGYLFKKGSNFRNNKHSPHTNFLAALEAPATLRYRLRDGTEYPSTALVDPNNYDFNGVLTPMTGTRWSIQRFTLFPSNLIRIQYGQATYGSKTEAIQAISTELFVEEQNIAENGLLRGILVVRRNTTALNNMTYAQFFEADKFGSTRFSASGTSLSTLQQAYNNSVKPQIVTTAEMGPVQIQRGSAVDTDAIQEFLDGAGAIRAVIRGDGSASFGNKAAGNYSGFEPDGSYRMVGDATVYDDISLSGMSFAPGGAAAPDIINFVTPNLKVYGFDGGGTVERLYITSESKHEYEEGSELEFHVHWTPTTTGAGNVKWQAYVSWMSVDGIFSAPTLLTGVSPARGQAWQNTYITLGTIPGAGMTINSQLVIQIFRDPGDAQDTYASDAAFIAFGIHYKKDTVGSRTRTAK